MIVGLPWLKKHKPGFDWDKGRLKFVLGLSEAEAQPSAFKMIGDKWKDLVPEEFQGYERVFNEKYAGVLPPNRPWDCRITLEENAKLQRGSVYATSGPEREALKEYLREEMSKGYIKKVPMD